MIDFVNLTDSICNNIVFKINNKTLGLPFCNIVFLIVN